MLIRFELRKLLRNTKQVFQLHLTITGAVYIDIKNNVIDDTFGAGHCFQSFKFYGPGLYEAG